MPSNQAVALDFNGDHRADVAVPNGSNIELLMGRSGSPLNPGAGPTSGPLTIVTGVQATYGWGGMSPGDFNGDGNGDVIVATAPAIAALQPSRLLRRCRGAEQLGLFRFYVVGVADVNGDGRSEISTFDGSVTGGTMNAATASRAGSPLTALPMTSSLGLNANVTGAETLAGDFNDGIDDVLVLSAVWVQSNNGPGVPRHRRQRHLLHLRQLISSPPATTR